METTMFPESLLDGVPWVFSETSYDTLDEFIAAVSEYQVAMEQDANWNASAVAIEARKLAISTEIYNENEEEVDVTFEVTTKAEAFMNGELLFQLHNWFASKRQAGWEVGDHCFFEGLHLEDADAGTYGCYLGS